MPDDDRYSLTELADLAGVTPRTVRYYLGQGLLPAVGQSGPGSKYDSGHLLRLRLIRRLQAEHLPLAEIRRRLEGLTEADIRALAVADEPAPPADSALDYLRTVLGGPPAPASMPAPMAAPMHALTVPSFSVTRGQALLRRTVASEATPMYLRDASVPSSPAPSEAPTPVDPPALERSQWERIALASDVELHIRRPLTRAQQKGVDRLVTIARELLEEDHS